MPPADFVPPNRSRYDYHYVASDDSTTTSRQWHWLQQGEEEEELLQDEDMDIDESLDFLTSTTSTVDDQVANQEQDMVAVPVDPLGELPELVLEPEVVVVDVDDSIIDSEPRPTSSASSTSTMSRKRRSRR